MPIRLSRFEMPKRVVKDDATATATYSRFIAEPFEVGYGRTIGNSLRRVLLSSIEGAAISSVRIKGAEHEFLRHLGLSVVSQHNSKTISWPRVAAKCDYRQSIRFEQIVNIDVSVRRIGTKSVTYCFRFHMDDATIAEGEVTAVCCEIPHGDIRKPMKPVPIEIPQEFRDKLQPYVNVES